MSDKEQLPKTQLEAARMGMKEYYTGRPCKHGHIAERWAMNGACKECARIRSVNWQRGRRALIKRLKKEAKPL